MTKDEALKMVIDNLELQDFNTLNATLIAYCKEALATNKESLLVQPAQEPVAWMSEGGIFTRTKEHAESWSNHGGKVTPVYTHPAPSWQGLSDDEIRAIDDVTLGDYYVEELATKFARAIEQELRSKNART